MLITKFVDDYHLIDVMTNSRIVAALKPTGYSHIERWKWQHHVVEIPCFNTAADHCSLAQVCLAISGNQTY